MISVDKNKLDLTLEIPILNDDNITPIYIEDFPFPIREVMDDLASSLLSSGGGKVLVKGLGGVGKSFIIQQFANNSGNYLKNTDLNDLVFIKLNHLHIREMQMIPGGINMFINACKKALSVRDEELCFVTENPEIASLINLENPKVKLIMEISTPTFNELLKGENSGKTKFWTSWDDIDIDTVLLTKKELIDLMSLSILPVKEKVKFGRREISLFVSHMLRNFELTDKDNRILIPAGLWSYAFRRIIGILTFSSDKKLKNKENDIIYSNVMKKVSGEISNIFSNYLKYYNSLTESETDKFLNSLKAMGIPVFSSDSDLSSFFEIKNEADNEPPVEYNNKFKDFSTLKERLAKDIIGQDEAIDTLVNSLIVPAAGLHDKTKPLASFLFTGKSGVGKTSLAYALSRELMEEELNVVRLDLSEYGSKHEASKLFGSAPGYVGYEEGGILTNAIKEHPNSIILLDEVEKADLKIWDTFLQVFDAGRLTDNKGNTVDFTNTIIIMTSNLGIKNLSKNQIGFGDFKDIKEVNKNNEIVINKAIKEYFKPEFINRIGEIIFFNELSKDNINTIIRKELSKVTETLKESGVEVKTDKKVIDEIFNLSDTTDYGAREVQRVISRNVISPIAKKIIQEADKKISLTVDKNKKIVIN